MSDPKAPNLSPLERDLAAITAPPAPTPDSEAALWERALARHDREQFAPRRSRLDRPMSTPWAAAAAMLIVGAVIVILLLPSLGRSRSVQPVTASADLLAEASKSVALGERDFGLAVSAMDHAGQTSSPSAAGAAELPIEMAAAPDSQDLAASLARESARAAGVPPASVVEAMTNRATTQASNAGPAMRSEAGRSVEGSPATPPTATDLGTFRARAGGSSVGRPGAAAQTGAPEAGAPPAAATVPGSRATPAEQSEMSRATTPTPPTPADAGDGVVLSDSQPAVPAQEGSSALNPGRELAFAAPQPAPPLPTFEPAAFLNRLVVRRAEIDLIADAPHAAAAQVGSLLSEAEGEFVQSSTVQGEASAAGATATVVLRVRAERLPVVLERLRGLGKLDRESQTGEDVTDQVVDLEARLRNERRVESELLQVMEARVNDDLRDVLELRNQLSAARERVERLVAQRDQVGRRVVLATMTATFKTPAARGAEVEAGFTARLGAAWTRGVATLGNSVTWMVETLIGGLIVWIILLLIAAGLIAVFRVALRAGGHEPPPRG